MENERMNILSGIIPDTAIEVHKIIGPGLLEKIYELCLCKEFDLRGIKYSKHIQLPIIYKGMLLDSALKIDILVEEMIIVELKAVETVHQVYYAQLLSHLRLTKKKSGLMINFKVPRLVDGFKRIIN